MILKSNDMTGPQLVPAGRPDPQHRVRRGPEGPVINIYTHIYMYTLHIYIYIYIDKCVYIYIYILIDREREREREREINK